MFVFGFGQFDGDICCHCPPLFPYGKCWVVFDLIVFCVLFVDYHLGDGGRCGVLSWCYEGCS